ncbi:MAG: shikimate dehydrogenase [bacterium]|nr:shikimate dehydrogenase [bacterium]
MITAKTKILGLIGYPATYSLSPIMHNAAFKQLGLDYVYLVFPAESNDLRKAMEGLKAIKFAGANVTIPYKEVIMDYLDEISKEARLIGAVNTIKNIEGKLYGYNTDGFGFIESLKKQIGIFLKGKKVFMLGAGGAAKAVALSLALEEVSEIVIVDKFKKKAMDLSDYLEKNIDCKSVAIRIEDVKIGKKISNADIIVNATPVGMKKEDPLLIDVKYLREDQIIYDLIYTPQETLLLKEARRLKLKAINGLEMLLYQGAKSFNIWTERDAPIEIMRKALSKELE